MIGEGYNEQRIADTIGLGRTAEGTRPVPDGLGLGSVSQTNQPSVFGEGERTKFIRSRVTQRLRSDFGSGTTYIATAPKSYVGKTAETNGRSVLNCIGSDLI